METVWVLGDQLNRRLGPLRLAEPSTSRVLMVESSAKLGSKSWHRQRAHLVICAMRRFAAELGAEGFEVDYRKSPSLAAGFEAHRDEYQPSRVLAMEPASFDGLALLGRLGVELALQVVEQLVPAHRFILSHRHVIAGRRPQPAAAP